MHKTIALSLAVALFGAGSSAVAQGVSTPVIDIRSPLAGEAAATVEAFHAALQKNDVPAALATLTDDVVIFEGGHVERSKAEYAEHHAPADAVYAAAAPSTLLKQTAFAEGNVAWVISESRAPGRYKEKAVDQLTTETMVLRREAAGWRIAHIHWSSRATPK